MSSGSVVHLALAAGIAQAHILRSLGRAGVPHIATGVSSWRPHPRALGRSKRHGRGSHSLQHHVDVLVPGKGFLWRQQMWIFISDQAQSKSSEKWVTAPSSCEETKKIQVHYSAHDSCFWPTVGCQEPLVGEKCCPDLLQMLCDEVSKGCKLLGVSTMKDTDVKYPRYFPSKKNTFISKGNEVAINTHVEIMSTTLTILCNKNTCENQLIFTICRINCYM